MKRTWVVHVGMNEGHEYNGMLSFMDWFGPYTEAQAKRLEEKLNNILEAAAEGESEHNVATAMPLDSLSPRQVIAKIKSGEYGEY